MLLPPLRQQVLDLDRQLAHADTGRVVDGRRHRGGKAREADLADAARAELVDLPVGKVEEVDAKSLRISVPTRWSLTQHAASG